MFGPELGNVQRKDVLGVGAKHEQLGATPVFACRTAVHCNGVSLAKIYIVKFIARIDNNVLACLQDWGLRTMDYGLFWDPHDLGQLAYQRAELESLQHLL